MKTYDERVNYISEKIGVGKSFDAVRRDFEIR